MELNRMQTKLKFSKCFIKGKAMILCFILVLVAVSVTMSPILSAWQGYRVRVPNVPVNMVETYPGVSSYFDTNLSGIGAGYDVHNGVYTGWCCDEHHYIYPGTLYSVQLYSTYNPSMPWPDPDWDMVNYLLNHKDSTAGKDRIQSAIWFFINGGYSGSDPKILGMINAAIAHGEGFLPQEGQICAVLCDAGDTVQHTFIEVLVPPPPCTVYVDDDYTISTPGYGYDHFKIIQDGVDVVAECGTVYVYEGTYAEQVIINKNVSLLGVNKPIITAPDPIKRNNYTIAESSNIFNPILFAYGGTLDTSNHVTGSKIISVYIDGFKIDGKNTSAGSGDYRYVGILYRNIQPGCTISQISNNTIYNLYDKDGEGNGPQTCGILVYGNSKVNVIDNNISKYSRLGIGGIGDNGLIIDPTLSIKHNAVTGNGLESSTSWWAENGIQLSSGAGGSIIANTIRNCRVNNPDWVSTGILVDDANDGVIIQSNNITLCDTGINLISPSYDLIDHNTVTYCTYDGIRLGWPTDNVTVTNNICHHNEIGVSLYDATDNDVHDNTIYQNDYGIYIDGDSHNNEIYYNKIYQNNVDGIYIAKYNGYTPSGNIIYCNDIYQNTVYGLENYDIPDHIQATRNWWGDSSGPSGAGPGTGDKITTNVDYDPWIGFIIADANGPYYSDSIGIVHFSSTGSHGSGCCDETPLSYDWDFGDGSPHDSGANPTHQYTVDGHYTVTLIVTATARGHSYQDSDQTNVITCFPNIVVNKTVWDGSNWVDDIRVANGTLLQFKISIKNDGNCPLDDITIADILSTPQLEYRDQSSIMPISSSEHTVNWTTSIDPGQTIEITYFAMAVHVCYGWNSVNITDSMGTEIGYDIVQVKVINNFNQPELDITKQVWDGITWSSHIELTANADLMFKITVSSTSLFTAHNIIVIDNMPLLVQYNDHATPAPSASPNQNQVIWKFDDISPGTTKEITYNVTVIKMGTDYNIASVTSDEGYYDEDYVLLTIDSPPSINLIYPQGGETLKNIVTIQWYAHDVKDGGNLPIYIYFKDANASLWTAFNGNPYSNSGTLNWDTTSLPDGSYQLQVVAQDSNNNLGRDTSTPFQIKNHEQPPQNNAPNKPSTPQGGSNGKINAEYTYTSSTTDPDGDQVYYLWDWGDGTNSGWLGPYNSGAAISTTHTWTVKGSYSVKVKAKDTYGKESSYSDPLPITMPYSFNNPILPFLERWFQRFPHAFPILRHLLGY